MRSYLEEVRKATGVARAELASLRLPTDLTVDLVSLLGENDFLAVVESPLDAAKGAQALGRRLLDELDRQVVDEALHRRVGGLVEVGLSAWQELAARQMREFDPELVAFLRDFFPNFDLSEVITEAL